MSLNFWSESRTSVNRNLRNMASRESNAEIDAAAPTCNSKVSSRSPPELIVFIRFVYCRYVSQSPCRCKGRSTSHPCYNTGLPMPRKSSIRSRNGRKKPKTRIRIVARAKLPTRFGKFEILGIEGGSPEENAVVLVHGGVRNKTPLVRIHSQCLT